MGSPQVVADIDLDGLAANTAAVRKVIGPDIRFYGVCKGDAYGIGLLKAAPVLLEAGADALALADPAELRALRSAGIDAPVLLYPCTPPDMASQVAALGVTVSLTDLESIAAFAQQSLPVLAFLKVDCGFGRLGVSEADWLPAFAAIRRASKLRLAGLYTHLGHTDDPAAVNAQMGLFRRALAAAEAAGFQDLERLVASSRVVIGYPELRLDAVNPGRVLYGMLEAEWQQAFSAAPVVRSISSRIIQVKTLPAGARPGYLDGAVLDQPRRIAVLSAGFVHGLPRIANDLPVLVRGRQAPALGMRSTEHMVVDVTDIPDAAAGDEAVLYGPQGQTAITAERLAGMSGVPLIELLPRMTRGATRRYRRSSNQDH